MSATVEEPENLSIADASSIAAHIVRTINCSSFRGREMIRDWIPTDLLPVAVGR
jgi:hypothetical protein